MLETLAKILHTCGFIVVGTASDGIEVLLQYGKLQPDIVIMDISMPRMDGITALKEIRKMDPQAKIVIVSAMGFEDDVRAAIKAGANNFIVKPFEIDTLVMILNDLS